MSAPGRPKRESFEREREGRPMSAHGRSEALIPQRAFSYLRSHGELDREHTAHFARLMNLLDDPADRQAVIHAATMFYRLYGDVFRSLPLPAPRRAAEEALA